MPVNHVVLASGAVVAVSVAVATLMAMYESPELRRYADDVRRRIAIALYSVGDGINPPSQSPRFNRPEDADGFLMSQRGDGTASGVDADEETRRRQREELLYWNSLRMEKLGRQPGEEEAESTLASNSSAVDIPSRPKALEQASRGSSFDDFLQQDDTAEQGAYVFSSGTSMGATQDGLRRRGEAARGFTTSLYANPFADEHHIEHDEAEQMEASLIAPGPVEAMSDIYSATTREAEDNYTATLEPSEPSSPALVDLAVADLAHFPSSSVPESPATLERELGPDEFMSAGQDDRQEAYASIQAWAQDSSHSFYSPLPVTPVAPVSEPDVITDGQLTPTDSMSIIGSGGDGADDAVSSRDGEVGRNYDVMSESEGMATPASWSEVGSVISESDGHIHA